MQYKVTSLSNSDFCKLSPGSTECHFPETVEANSKAEAVNRIHTRTDFAFKMVGKLSLPEVWSVEEVL